MSKLMLLIQVLSSASYESSFHFMFSLLLLVSFMPENIETTASERCQMSDVILQMNMTMLI